MRVLVTGGAGYIGSHAVCELINQGHHVLVLDDLSNGHRDAVHREARFIQGSTGDQELLNSIFTQENIEAVMHFAANIEVAESVTNPGKYYANNFTNSLLLLRSMQAHCVQKIVFSSTAAVYGNPMKVPIEEAQERAPINPYGRSKMMVELALEDFLAAHGLGYTILRYFNVAGASLDASIGEDHHPESHLIPRILRATLRPQERLKIFGTDYATHDGTCVRDYIHVVDLARAHALALRKLQPGVAQVFNLGSEKGFSVREVIAACARVTGVKLQVDEVDRRPGDPAVLVASSARIREILGWERLYPNIDQIVADAWRWHQSHPEGYATPH